MKTKSKAVDAELADLGKVADELVKKIPPGKPCLQNLSEAAQDKVKHVHFTGGGVCSKCRWSSGCLECEGGHALLYWLRQEGFHEDAIKAVDVATELSKLSVSSD